MKKTKKHNKTKRVFKNSEYSAGDGFLTSTWGPPLWHYLHTMSFNYPVNPTQRDKKYYKDFILNLQHVLPCKYCRINLKTNLKQLPLKMSDMKNRDSFSRYVYNLHEVVNKMLNKKSNLSYCDVRERYEHFRARCTEENPTIFKFKKLDTGKLQTGKLQTRKKEKGCTVPLYGKKSKCIMKIVPHDDKSKTFQIDDKCIKKRGEE